MPNTGTFFTKIFKSEVNFNFATFHDRANFNGRTFENKISFTATKFTKGVDFNGSTFKQKVDFSDAQFCDVAFFRQVEFQENVSFTSATFKKFLYFDEVTANKQAYFNLAKFEDYAYFFNTKFYLGVDFVDAVFKQKAFFSRTRFHTSADFSKVTFDEDSQISFSKAEFKEIVFFTNAIINGYVLFEGQRNEEVFNGENVRLDLQNARIKNPDRISFHTVRLQPNWFINVESKKFVFTDCRWRKPNGKKINIKSELNNLENYSNLNALLTKACRQLADNYEENKGFEEASMFRQIAMESKRLSEDRGSQIWTLHWWYWLSSYYGESWKRALLILAIILAVFAFGYTQSTFYVCPPNIPISQSSQQNLCETRKLNTSEAIRQSLASATFQNVEYRKPVTERSEILVLLEKIFAPIQAALLALAIRRKFMR